MKTLAETLLNYYQEHEDDFNHDIEELDCWNGILGDGRCMYMDELDEIYQGKEATEILSRAYFGMTMIAGTRKMVRESTVSSIRTVIISILTDMGILLVLMNVTTVIILILTIFRTLSTMNAILI